jgi:glycosyltransferase 2 family protein
VKSAIATTLLKYGIGLGLLVWIISINWNPKLPRTEVMLLAGTGIGPSLSTPGLGDALDKPINPFPLILAFVIAGFALLLTFLRWQLLVKAQGLEFSRYDAIRLGLVGYFFNTFLPGAVGGDVLKAIGIAREQSRRTVAVATVLIDRLIGLWALILLVSLVGGSFFFIGNPILQYNDFLKGLVATSSLIVLSSIMIWVAVGFLPERRAQRFSERLESIPKIGGSFAELWRAVWMYRKQSRAVFLAIMLSLIGHTGWVLVFHFSSQAFEVENPIQSRGTLEEHYLIVPVGQTIGAIFPSPGGVGGQEAAYGELYHSLGKPKVNGILGCLAQRFVFWILGTFGYIVYLRMGSRTSSDEPPSDASSGEQTDPPKL